MNDPSPSEKKRPGPKKGTYIRQVPPVFAIPSECTLRSDNQTKFQGPAGDRERQLKEARQWTDDANQTATAAVNLLEDGNFYPRRSVHDAAREERRRTEQGKGSKRVRRKWNDPPPPPPDGNASWFWPLVTDNFTRPPPKKGAVPPPKKVKKQDVSKPPEMSDVNKWLVAHRALREEEQGAAAGDATTDGEPHTRVSDDRLKELVADVLSRPATIVEGAGATKPDWQISKEHAASFATMETPKDDPAWRAWYAAIRSDMSFARRSRRLVGATQYDRIVAKEMRTVLGQGSDPPAQPAAPPTTVA
jgi:hypothetical protein